MIYMIQVLLLLCLLAVVNEENNDGGYVSVTVTGNSEVSNRQSTRFLIFNNPMESTINHILTNPLYRDILAILKGARNGIVYGTVGVCQRISSTLREMEE
jgi:hypothetical protein